MLSLSKHGVWLFSSLLVDVTPAKAGVQKPGEETGFPLPRE
jgi:hypothetical protein